MQRKVRYYDARENRMRNGILSGRDGEWCVQHLDDGLPQSDCLLSPGWIDMHTHIFDGVGLFGTSGEAIGYRTGVCMLVDAGTVGEYTLDGFTRYVAPTLTTDYRLFLCISPIGVIFHHEYNAMQYLDPDRCASCIRAHRDQIAGVKVRMGKETIRHEGLEPLRLASLAARKADVPMMVHIGGNPPYLEDMVPYFEKGDVLTHAFNGRGNDVWNSDGTPTRALSALLEKGVILDVGHGSSSFDFNRFEKALRHPLPRFLMGTDLHQSAIKHLVRNMGVMLSKMYGCGVSLEDILYGVTQGPAEVLRLQDWCGMEPLKNATLFRIVDHRETYEDCQGNQRTFDKAFQVEATILNGVYHDLAKESAGQT